MPGNKVAGGHGAVKADAGATRRAVRLDAAGVRLKVQLRILTRDPALDGIALWLPDRLLNRHNQCFKLQMET